MKAVTTEMLSKIYSGNKKALSGMSIALEPGEVFGFLGPNGAGKTTTIKLLTGMLSPTEGFSRVFNLDPSTQQDQVHQLCGVMTEHAQMYDNLTGIQNLVFYGTLFGLKKEECQKRALSLLEELNLEDAGGKKLAAYSTGMRQRLSLARAMIHRPKLLFLDEPTSGLDPESAHSVNQMIRNLAQDEGTTVFLCTHQLRYAQEVCSTYGLIDDGSLLASGSIEALRSLVFSGLTVEIQADRFPNTVRVHRINGNIGEIDVSSQEDIPPLVRQMIEGGSKIYSVQSRRLSLEEIYFSLLERRKKKEAAQ